MSNAVFGWNNHLLTAALTAGSEASELPVSNLVTEHGDPASSWQTAVGVLTPQAGAWFAADTGLANSRWRAFALARTNLTPGARVRWRVGGRDSIVERTPAALLDFAPGFSLPSGATFTRATKARAFDAAGTLTEFGAGVPREGYDPVTLAYLGHIFEPQARTNGIRNPRGEGASTGSPGGTPTNWTVGGTLNGMTRSVTASVTESGIPGIDLGYAGTPTATFNRDCIFDTSTAVAAAQGQTWTASVYLRLVSGSTTNVTLTLFLQELDSGGAVLASYTAAVAPTGDPLRTQRASVTATFANASTAYTRMFLRYAFTNGQAADVTLRIGAPQLEQGGHASLPILPDVGSPAATTRNADVLTWAPGDNYRNSPDGGALFAEFVVAETGVGTGTADIRLDDGSNSNRVTIRYTPSTGMVDGLLHEGGTIRADTSNIPVSVGATVRTVMVWDDTTFTGATNGTAHSTHAPAAMPATLTRLALVGSAVAATLGVRRIAVYTPALNDGSRLQISTDGSTLDGAAAYDSGWLDDGIPRAASQRVHVAPAEIAGRYARCDIEDPSNGDGFVRVALAYAGPAWQPRFNFHPETVFAPERAAREARTRGGQTWYELLWAERAWEVSHQWTEDADMWAQLMAMEQAAALGRNVLFVPFPASADRNREAVFGPMRMLAPVGFIAPGTKLRTWRARFSERL
ncbi:hypothetical protein GCM10010964_43680 [Caldovatus sediminis]|uniref:Uncharacterized protein n=1 Tax=Caldovatus sediminis TaxID=2041189 RepID=A0A8J2ZG24_9PROT|nr:hypothetical protein [Caldovatus sediminis]GGG51765.1 hypothetical protein GCM10010964_43680 [Caldovatus sediminis]